MRYSFAQSLLSIAQKDKKAVLMTGDLGFNVFEPLAMQLGKRFINAGVAEHNMVTAAAGMAYTGLSPWIYSIAPFVTIKVLEELRNDVALPCANVKIVGLGGGYDYAIAGPTHHALEDIALIRTLPNFKIYAPGFDQDVSHVVSKMHSLKGPSYLRLTKAQSIDVLIPKYKPVRKLLSGHKITVIVLGSIITNVIQACKPHKDKIDLFVISELPFNLSSELVASIKKNKTVIIVEEHIRTGALGHYLSHVLRDKKINIENFIHLYATGYVSGKFGSRDFYLRETGLDVASIRAKLKKLL